MALAECWLSERAECKASETGALPAGQRLRVYHFSFTGVVRVSSVGVLVVEAVANIACDMLGNCLSAVVDAIIGGCKAWLAGKEQMLRLRRG